MIKVGVIGYGYWGPNLVRNFHQSGSTKLVGVSDIRQERLKEVTTRYPEVIVTTNYKDLLNNPEVEAVVIATPVETHYNIAKEALEAGKHVLVEKPLTNTVSEAKDLVKIATEKGKTLMVDHTFLYLTETEKLKELVSSGELGEIYTVSMQRLSLGLFQRHINVIQDLIPHDIAILNYILGQKPITVNTSAAYACVGKGRGMEDTAHVVLQYPNASIVTAHVSWVHPEKKRVLTIVGSNKMVVCDFENRNHPIMIYNKGADNYQPFAPPNTAEQHNLVHYRDQEIVIPPVKGNGEALNSVAVEFAKAIKENRKPKTDGEDGLAVVQVLDAALQSMREGRKVEIKY